MRAMTNPQNIDLNSRYELLRGTWWPAMEAVIEELLNQASFETSLLRAMVKYQLSTGGKRLRAVLPLLTAQALGCDPAPLIPFGAACEMLHNASLVHDDLQDGDAVRRGRPAVWKQFGMPQAINLGDAMIAFTLLLVGQLKVAPEVREKLTGRLLFEMLRVIEGQVQDLDIQIHVDLELSSYMRMVEGKTSSLFALPMGGAALLCGAAEEIEKGLVEAACQIGVLFQIQDDIFDIYGDGSGKPSGSDIRSGKHSVLAAHCFEHGAPDETARLRLILDKPANLTTPADIVEARAVFESAGSLDFALAELDRRKRAALSPPSLSDHPGLLKMLEDACSIFLLPVRKLESALGSRRGLKARAFLPGAV